MEFSLWVITEKLKNCRELKLFQFREKIELNYQFKAIRSHQVIIYHVNKIIFDTQEEHDKSILQLQSFFIPNHT
jgi:hypothetical protein